VYPGSIAIVGNLADLESVLTLVIDQRAQAAARGCAATYSETGDVALLGLQSFAHFHAQEFESASAVAAIAIERSAGNPAALALARGAAGLAAAAWPVLGAESPRPDSLLDALGDTDALDGVDADYRAFVLYLLAEASLACARLDLAAQFIERSGPVVTAFLQHDGMPHPYLTVMQVMRMRALGFQGSTAEALSLGELARTSATAETSSLLLDATLCFVLGTAAQGETVLPMADRLERELPLPGSYISTGSYLLVAYGLLATGELARAVQFVLLAGRDAGLEGLAIVDRALGLDLLTASAVLAGDLDAAEAWREQARPLLAHPSSRATVERLFGRVELLAGRPTEALAWARLAVEHAVADGRAVEAASAEALLEEARTALGSMGAPTGDAVVVVSEAFAAQLPPRRRRPQPQSGTGWSGLSPREREVARLITEGDSNRAIAARLHLSQHTVRAHVSRVLAAFGVASRFAVAARLADLMPGDGAAPPAPLTPRQRSVVERIVLGHTNDEIARDLQISIKTVEKHVSEILRRWNVTSRIGISRTALAARKDAS
jgi:DNA-binding NarL/FixJ family response regulator